MEDSFNSDSSVDLGCVFKKQTEISRGFEVSLEESVPAAGINKSDLNTTDTGERTLQFKRKSNQLIFNVDSCESVSTSVLDDIETFVKPKPVLNKKNQNKSLNDFFNVSFNETNTSLLENDETNTDFTKTNLFKTGNQNRNEISIRDETLMAVNESALEKSTTFITTENPFKKNNSLTELQVSVRDEDKSITKNGSRTDFRLNEDGDSTSMKTKLNLFQLGNSSQTPEMNNRELSQTLKNISVDRSISKLSNNSCFESSVNDENLNNWMSDQSHEEEEEEVAPPKTPTETNNLSHTKEKPPVLGSPTETNPLLDWKLKFDEIVSNAEKKLTEKSHSDIPLKKKPSAEANSQKPVKSKPVKLIKPAPFATRQFYDYIIKKLKPKYGIDTVIEAENLVQLICDTVKKVTRRKSHQKSLIQNLKKEMAKAGLIETTWDFYEYVIKFLPYAFRVKVVPCIQPVTNVVYPPKDVVNPFEKIL